MTKQLFSTNYNIISDNNTPKNLKSVASLFAGIGGIDIAFKQAGFDINWSNDIDEKACDTYVKNFNHKNICSDIKDLKITKEMSNIGVLTAGFPCQAFSVAGYRKGFNDDRGNIFFVLFKVIEQIKPACIFLENVKNLNTHDKGRTFRIILNKLEQLGYHIKHQVMNTCEYSNIPQNRERIYIVGFLDKTKFNNFEFPSKVKTLTPLVKIIDKQADNKYYYTKTKYYQTLKAGMKNKNTCYQWRWSYLRENKNNLCPTLTANMGTGGHNVPLVLDSKDIRKLTPRECARLQGFKDDFILPNNLADSALYKQIGNSVSIPVITRIAKNIYKVLVK